MVTIRLSRIGKKKKPVYRIIVSEKGRDTHGKYLEVLGHFDPLSKPPSIKIKGDRVKEWISKGATVSDTIWNILINEKIVEGEKRNVVSVNKKKKAAIQEIANKKVAEAEKAAAAEKAKKEADKVAEESATKENTETVAPEVAPVETEKSAE